MRLKLEKKIGIVIEESDLLNIDNYLKKLTEREIFKKQIENEKEKLIFNFQNSTDYIFKELLKDL